MKLEYFNSLDLERKRQIVADAIDYMVYGIRKCENKIYLKPSTIVKRLLLFDDMGLLNNILIFSKITRDNHYPNISNGIRSLLMNKPETAKVLESIDSKYFLQWDKDRIEWGFEQNNTNIKISMADIHKANIEAIRYNPMWPINIIRVD